MRQYFSRPDLYCSRSGRLDCAVARRAIPGAPAFLRGLRALLVCDTHVLGRTPDEAIDALVRTMAAQKPDILLLGGDYADHTEDARRLFQAMAAIKPPLGGFGVIGNNDAEAWPETDELREVMAAAGFKLLVNESVALPVNGGTLYIGGVDERKFGQPRARCLYPAQKSPNTYRVLLSHYPCMPDLTPDLMLSGHTHGGQFNLLGLTPFSIGFERLLHPRMAALAVAGLHERDGMRLYVSKGVGASRIQWRVGVRPEIDLLTFE